MPDPIIPPNPVDWQASCSHISLEGIVQIGIITLATMPFAHEPSGNILVSNYNTASARHYPQNQAKLNLLGNCELEHSFYGWDWISHNPLTLNYHYLTIKNKKHLSKKFKWSKKSPKLLSWLTFLLTRHIHSILGNEQKLGHGWWEFGNFK